MKKSALLQFFIFLTMGFSLYSGDFEENAYEKQYDRIENLEQRKEKTKNFVKQKMAEGVSLMDLGSELHILLNQTQEKKEYNVAKNIQKTSPTPSDAVTCWEKTNYDKSCNEMLNSAREAYNEVIRTKSVLRETPEWIISKKINKAAKLENELNVYLESKKRAEVKIEELSKEKYAILNSVFNE